LCCGTGEGTATSTGIISITSANTGVSGASGKLVFSSGSALIGNSGVILIGSGSATGGCSGLVSLSAGSGTSGTGGSVHLFAGSTIGSVAGGGAYINAGRGSVGDGQVCLKQDSNAVLTISSSSISSQHQTTSLIASSGISVASSTGLTLSGNSGVTFSSGYVHGFECTASTTVVSSAAATVNTMGGVLTSESSTLGAGSTEMITLSNTHIVTSSIIWVTIKSRCLTGYVSVSSVTASSGSAAIVMYNLGDAACTSTYQLFFLVLN
jgi:hypothetical protein